MTGDRNNNEYLPRPARITAVRRETFDVKTFSLEFVDRADAFSYKQGQFAEISVLGQGEVPISITSSPSRKGPMEFTIRAAGRVTSAMHDLGPGDALYLRGPYGNAFPFETLKGRNLYFVAGGIGLAPLRSLINMVLDSIEDFGDVKILYGAKNPEELCFRGELEEWKAIPGVEVYLTVDRASPGWTGPVGLVTALWDAAALSPENAVAILCGPPIMIKFAAAGLSGRGFGDEAIVMTLERYMKCGVGKCGHCNIGGSFVCTDGPVFDYAQVKRMPEKEGVF
ncbi:MAG: FAD/NAD(P)-binding protein [Treponema sp.]|nr:FAD/NAD(P)-binding protein [Treponema sp.]